MTLWTASGLWQKTAITSGSEPRATVNLFSLSLTHSDSVLLATGDRLIDYPHSLVGLSGVTFGEAGTSEMTATCSGGRYNIFALSQPETVSVSFRRQPACQWPTASHKIIYTPWGRNLANDSPVRVLVSKSWQMSQAEGYPSSEPLEEIQQRSVLFRILHEVNNCTGVFVAGLC